MKRLAKRTKKLALFDSQMLNTLVVEATRGPKTSLHLIFIMNLTCPVSIYKEIVENSSLIEWRPSY